MENIWLRFRIAGGVATRRRGFPGVRRALCVAACLGALALPADLLSQQNMAKEPPGVLRFRLSRNSMQPSQITVSEGMYVIQVTNGVLLAPIEFYLDDDKGARVGNAATKNGGARARTLAVFSHGGSSKKPPFLA